MKRILCLIIALIICTTVLASCDKDEKKVNKITGELKSDAFSSFRTIFWIDSGRGRHDWDNEHPETLDEFVTSLANGGRFMAVAFSVKELVDLDEKKLKKVTFTLESDRDITVTLALNTDGINDKTVKQTVSLSANTPIEIELAPNTDCAVTGDLFAVEFLKKAEGWNRDAHYDYGTYEQGEWSQAVYKVTNFKVYCE